MEEEITFLDKITSKQPTGCNKCMTPYTNKARNYLGNQRWTDENTASLLERNIPKEKH